MALNSIECKKILLCVYQQEFQCDPF